MDLVNKTVEHRRYGEGKIISFDGEYISVFFPDFDETKQFLYPQCFQGALSLLDTALKEAIKEDAMKKAVEDTIKQAERENKIHNDLILNRINKSNNKKETQALRFSSIEEFCNHYIKLLQSEIYYLKTTGGKHKTVHEGKYIQKKSDRYYYEFETDTELNANNGANITIYWNTDKLSGIIENCDENSIIISTEHNIGNNKESTIQSLEFSVEGWLLLEALIKRLEEVKKTESLITKQLISSGFSNITPNSSITTGQEKAVEMSLSQPITFIWGPPGTGKTETLAKIAKRHIQCGHRVLMLSYSNVSVDGAIQRVFKLMPDVEPGIVLRYGYPKDEDIKSSQIKFSFNYALKSDTELSQRNKRLRQEYKEIDKLSDRAKELRKEIKAITLKVAEREKTVIKQAAFVATTISKAIIDKSIFEQKFDVVIFDEASMSYVPQIIAGSNMAQKHFVCMGDFNQLPPIVQGDYSDYLSVDIFKHCGIYEAVSQNKGHSWLCMLDTQYRMHANIANIASKSMYFGLLKTAEGISSEREKILKSIPEIKEAYGLADLSNMMSTCIPLQDHSRANILSAFVSFALASRAGQSYDTGIITPYSSQARLLQNMAKDYSENIKHSDPVSSCIPCATVHQFQGSEKDVIIYDAVDCYRLQHPGVLLSNQKDNYANKLFNVALTRARGKFVVTTNANFMLNKGINSNLVFGKTINLSKPFSEINGSVISSLKLEHDCFQFIDKNKSLDMFIEDIRNAKKSIYIDIPDSIEDNSKANKAIVSNLLEQKRKGLKIIVRAENRKNLPKELIGIAIEHSFCMTPIAIVDKKTIWYGMPWSNAQFNVSNKSIPTKYYPIIRFIGSRTARSIFGILEMNRTIDESKEVISEGEPTSFAQYVLSNSTCPDCGKPLQLKCNKKGNPFLSCTGYPACTYLDKETSTYAMVYVANNKISCPKCQSSLEVKDGRYGTYIRCTGATPHNINLSEL